MLPKLVLSLFLFLLSVAVLCCTNGQEIADIQDVKSRRRDESCAVTVWGKATLGKV